MGLIHTGGLMVYCPSREGLNIFVQEGDEPDHCLHEQSDGGGGCLHGKVFVVVVVVILVVVVVSTIMND